ncbi:MAG: diguanylate cyclase [Rhodospirillales bacterium]|jgi:diguanylate cyclase (GGDEF)-like protein|nr:diguanylate cyclase [Rhodospirillales bacterium]
MDYSLPDNERGTILIVDDDPMNIDILSEILEDHHEILFATSGADALKVAEAEAPDLIVLDVVMPEMDGYEVCASLKANPVTATIPVIFVTGLTSVSDEARGLEVGAVDYITKPVSPPIVLMRVGNHIKLTKALAMLAKLSTTDGLTELANRRHLDSRIELECCGLRRPTGPLSVIMLDIDYFKNFNDTYGHLAGDDCLKEVSRLIAETVRRSLDMAARYGGEEFCCVLPVTDHEDAMKIAEDIRENILALKIPNRGSDISKYVTVSLGVVTIVPDGNIPPADVIAMADERLYAAKNAGRNRTLGKDFVTTV